ncbi:hypothetical protein LCGC14_1490030 [marine sediment metagenome]|uniref:Uncharacterized protein n=1 Tax=marine sediment metagenome TaxID=412755 RepID=A0A0F9J7N5_9ZZZZ
MKLAHLQEVKYAEPNIIHLTGIFSTGVEGEYTEPDVTIVIKRGKTASHVYHDTTLSVVQSVQGGKIAEKIVQPDMTARLNRDPKGWFLNGYGFTTTKEYDTWVLFDPNYDTK